ncbi:MAG: sulfatase [Myxococcales bacterium]|nr:sulfatase [Myxococcales bacterium]
MGVSDEPTRGRGLAWPGCLLLGWSLIAAVNAVMMSLGLRGSAPGAARPKLTTLSMMHVHAIGQCLAVGVGAALLAAGWSRLGLRRRWGVPAILLGASLIGYPLLRGDLVGPASRLASDALPANLWTVALVVPLACSVPVAAWIAARMRGWLRLVPLLGAVAVAAANHLILPQDYAGAHLLLATAAACVAAGALRDLRPPVRGRAALAAFGVAAVWGAFAVIVPPANAVRLALSRHDGAALAPFLTRDRGPMDASAARRDDPWFRPRAEAQPVPPSPRLLPPDAVVLLIGVDSLRADLLADDARAKQLPQLRRLRDGGLWFRDVRAPGSQTVYTWAQVMAGTYFSQQYWTNKKARGRLWLWPHEDQTVRFPTLLAEGGVPTVNVTPAPWLINAYGIVRGFTEERYVKPSQPREMYTWGNELTDDIIERLKAHRDGPLFLFVHYLDAHAPYDRGTKKGAPFDRYVAELALVDRDLGRIRAALDETGLAKRTWMIVTSDHGQAFGEHDTTTHAKTLYDELLKVPLLVHGPGLSPRVIDDRVTLMDLGPTLLDLFQQPTPPHFMGQSLVPLIAGGAANLTRPVVAEGRLKQAMVFPDGYKVIRDQRNGSVELYDLRKDPDELVNLADAEPELLEERLGDLHGFFEVHKIRRPGYTIPYRR